MARALEEGPTARTGPSGGPSELARRGRNAYPAEVEGSPSQRGQQRPQRARGGIDARAAALVNGLTWQGPSNGLALGGAPRGAGKQELPAIARPPKKGRAPQHGLAMITAPDKLASLEPDVQVLSEPQERAHRKLAGGLAHSARAGYGEARSKWLGQCTRRGLPPLFAGETKR